MILCDLMLHLLGPQLQPRGGLQRWLPSVSGFIAKSQPASSPLSDTAPLSGLCTTLGISALRVILYFSQRVPHVCSWVALSAYYFLSVESWKSCPSHLLYIFINSLLQEYKSYFHMFFRALQFVFYNHSFWVLLCASFKDKTEQNKTGIPVSSELFRLIGVLFSQWHYMTVLSYIWTGMW